MKIKTIVINLDRREDRYAEFLRNYQGDHERFSAIDGKKVINQVSGWDLKLKTKLQQAISVPDRHLPGVFGCWKSHLGVWDQLVFDDEYDAYLIFEDDFHRNNNFEERLPGVLNAIDFSFDIYYIGGRTRSSFNPKNMNEWIEVKKNGVSFYTSKNKVATGRDFDRGLFSYVLTKPGAKKLVSYVNEDMKNDRFIIAVDEWINKNKQRIDVCDVFPHLTWSPSAYKSDIR